MLLSAKYSSNVRPLCNLALFLHIYLYNSGNTLKKFYYLERDYLEKFLCKGYLA